MKKHRIVSCVLTAAIIFMILGNITASASTMRASPTLSSYGVVLTKGSSGGKVIITYDVLANSVAESLGVSSIVIYKSSGDYVTTIYPTTLNGLKTSNAMWHRSSYTYSGTSGVSYYAMVTVFATINGVTDSRTVKTNTVAAP
mgnify:CR=1 FL=1